MMNNNWEVVENCPECGEANIWLNLDPVSCDYEATCSECGKRMMLCDECRHADDNPDKKCDWHECAGCDGGCCFRRVSTFDTFSNVFLENGEENPNWDNELRMFKVRTEYVVAWLALVGESYDVFLNEYDWNDTYELYECAFADGAIISEWIAERPF